MQPLDSKQRDSTFFFPMNRLQPPPGRKRKLRREGRRLDPRSAAMNQKDNASPSLTGVQEWLKEQKMILISSQKSRESSDTADLTTPSSWSSSPSSTAVAAHEEARANESSHNNVQHEETIKYDEQDISHEDFLQLAVACHERGHEIEQQEGRLEMAIEYHEKALEFRMRCLDRDHLDTAISYAKIAAVYGKLGTRLGYDRALEYYDMALSILLQQVRQIEEGEHGKEEEEEDKKKNSSRRDQMSRPEIGIDGVYNVNIKSATHPIHHSIMGIYANMGSISLRQQDCTNSLKYYGLCLDYLDQVLSLSSSSSLSVQAKSKHHGSNEIPPLLLEKASILNTMGTIYSQQSDMNNHHFKKSHECYNQSLKIREQILGKGHYETLASYNNIGLMYMHQKDNIQAMRYFQLALANNSLVNSDGKDRAVGFPKKKLFSKTQTTSLLGDKTEYYQAASKSYSNIGTVYFNKGYIDKSLLYYMKCLEWQELQLKDSQESSHADVSSVKVAIAATYSNMAFAHAKKRNYEKAFEFHGKALDIYQAELGDQHLDTAKSHHNIGCLHAQCDNHDSALEEYKKALDIRRQVSGNECKVDIATTQVKMGLSYYAIGYYNEAIQNYQSAIEIQEKLHGTHHSVTGMSYNNIGTAYYKIREYAHALEFYIKALDIKVDAIGADNAGMYSLYSNIGAAYWKKGDKEEAVIWFQKACDVDRERFYRDHHRPSSRKLLHYMKHPNAHDHHSIGDTSKKSGYSSTVNFSVALDLESNGASYVHLDTGTHDGDVSSIDNLSANARLKLGIHDGISEEGAFENEGQLDYAFLPPPVREVATPRRNNTRASIASRFEQNRWDIADGDQYGRDTFIRLDNDEIDWGTEDVSSSKALSDLVNSNDHISDRIDVKSQLGLDEDIEHGNHEKHGSSNGESSIDWPLTNNGDDNDNQVKELQKNNDGSDKHGGLSSIQTINDIGEPTVRLHNDVEHIASTVESRDRNTDNTHLSGMDSNTQRRIDNEHAVREQDSLSMDSRNIDNRNVGDIDHYDVDYREESGGIVSVANVQETLHDDDDQTKIGQADAPSQHETYISPLLQNKMMNQVERIADIKGPRILQESARSIHKVNDDPEAENAIDKLPCVSNDKEKDGVGDNPPLRTNQCDKSCKCDDKKRDRHELESSFDKIGNENKISDDSQNEEYVRTASLYSDDGQTKHVVTNDCSLAKVDNSTSRVDHKTCVGTSGDTSDYDAVVTIDTKGLPESDRDVANNQDDYDTFRFNRKEFIGITGDTSDYDAVMTLGTRGLPAENDRDVANDQGDVDITRFNHTEYIGRSGDTSDYDAVVTFGTKALPVGSDRDVAKDHNDFDTSRFNHKEYIGTSGDTSDYDAVVTLGTNGLPVGSDRDVANAQDNVGASGVNRKEYIGSNGLLVGSDRDVVNDYPGTDSNRSTDDFNYWRTNFDLNSCPKTKVPVLKSHGVGGEKRAKDHMESRRSPYSVRSKNAELVSTEQPSLPDVFLRLSHISKKESPSSQIRLQLSKAGLSYSATKNKSIHSSSIPSHRVKLKNRQQNVKAAKDNHDMSNHQDSRFDGVKSHYSHLFQRGKAFGPSKRWRSKMSLIIRKRRPSVERTMTLSIFDRLYHHSRLSDPARKINRSFRLRKSKSQRLYGYQRSKRDQNRPRRKFNIPAVFLQLYERSLQRQIEGRRRRLLIECELKRKEAERRGELIWSHTESCLKLRLHKVRRDKSRTDLERELAKPRKAISISQSDALYKRLTWYKQRTDERIEEIRRKRESGGRY